MVLEAAAQLFEREGLTTTTNRIAERAGFSIGTVYQYFPNKHALLYALAERHVRAVADDFDALFERLQEHEPPFPETAQAIVELAVELHRDRPDLHRLMYAHSPRLPEGVTLVEEVYQRIVAAVTYHLRRCGRGGDDPELRAAMIVHGVDAQLHRVLLSRVDPADYLVRLVLNLTE